MIVLPTAIGMTLQAKVGWRSALRIAVDAAVFTVHRSARVLACVATDTIRISTCGRSTERWIVTADAVNDDVGSAGDWELTLRMGAA
jgi:hypothetical protein